MTLFEIHEPVLTSWQAAAILGCRPQTLRKWRVLGKGPRYVRLGNNPRGRVAYLKSDISAWLASHSFSSTSEETVKAAARECTLKTAIECADMGTGTGRAR
jgi:predicted DNA-binding transcriptional regulator AlpA